MIAGGLAELVFGIAAERRSLEDIASPLSLVRRVTEGVRTPRESTAYGS